MNPAGQTLATVLAVLLLLFLVVRQRLHAFVALLLVSVFLGLVARWPEVDPEPVLDAMQRGMGGTLGFVAVVVGLGAMFGQLLHWSGGARVLAQGLLGGVGSKGTAWALGALGFVISIPVFFDVAFVILAPLLYQLARETKRPLMSLSLPLLAGLAVTHAFVPPTPGPIGVAGILGADLGYVILFGAIAGLPAVALAGPFLSRLVAAKIPGQVPTADAGTDRESAVEPFVSPPSLLLVFALIALPIVLILLDTTTAIWLSDDELSVLGKAHPLFWLRRLASLFGHPFVALLLTTLLCFRLLGTRRGLSRERVRELANRALEPAGVIILITGAGGVLKQVMVDSGVGTTLAALLSRWGIAHVVLAFLIAALVRLMQGSATVAMLTAAGLVAPLLDGAEISEAFRALLVIPIAAGATAFSHVNDSGFWLVSRYLGLSTSETLRSWTVMTTVVGLVGLCVSLLLSAFV